jgi:hypothetical protein
VLAIRITAVTSWRRGFHRLRRWLPIRGFALKPIGEIAVPRILRVSRDSVSMVVVESFGYEIKLVVGNIQFHTVRRRYPFASALRFFAHTAFALRLAAKRIAGVHTTALRAVWSGVGVASVAGVALLGFVTVREVPWSTSIARLSLSRSVISNVKISSTGISCDRNTFVNSLAAFEAP